MSKEQRIIYLLNLSLNLSNPISLTYFTVHLIYYLYICIWTNDIRIVDPLSTQRGVKYDLFWIKYKIHRFSNNIWFPFICKRHL